MQYYFITFHESIFIVMHSVKKMIFQVQEHEKLFYHDTRLGWEKILRELLSTLE